MIDSASQEDFQRFTAVLCRHLRTYTADLPMDTGLEAAGLDSSSALNIMLDLEETFGVVFDPALFTEETFATPRSLWETLKTLRG
jgi:acyl carrier protein